MPINKAKKHFQGKDGHEKLNCADAIIRAFAEFAPKDIEKICKGHGKSPHGECGALCAAREILRKHNPDKIEALEECFLNFAGSKNCKEILKTKKQSCLACVEKAAEYLHSQVKK